MRKRIKRLLILVSCLAGLALILTLWSWQPKLYRVTVLPSLGGDFVHPSAINDLGQVAGFADMPKAAGITKTTYHLFLWDRQGGIRDLGPVQNDQVDMNNAGQIAATMHDPNGLERAFVWDPNQGRTVLPTLGGTTSRALRINDLGQVAGEADTPAGVRHAFLWDPISGIRDLTPSRTTETRAWYLNDVGQVVVFGQGGPILVDTEDNATLTQCSISVLGLLRINKSGDIAAADRSGTRRWDVALWREDLGAKTLFQLEADSVETPIVDDLGQVVVTWRDRLQFKLFERPLFPFTRHACLWDPQRGRISLDRYLACKRGEDSALTDLNDQGCILGQVWSTKNPGDSRGVLLEPISERWGR